MAEFGIVQAACRTTAGTQDFDVSGFGTPVAALVIVSYGTVAGTAVDHANVAIGGTDGTRQWSTTGHSKDATGGNTLARARGSSATRLVTMEDPDSTAIILGTFSAWTANGIRINLSTAPGSGYLVTVLLFGGSGISNAYTGSFASSSTQDASVTLTPGFMADVVITASQSGSWSDAAGGNGSNQVNMGFCVRGAGNPHTQFSNNFYDTDAAGTSGLLGVVDQNSISRSCTSATGAEVELQDFTSTQFSAYTRNAAAACRSGYIALKFNGLTAMAKAFDSPTSGGNQAVTGIGFTPQFGLLLMNALTSYDTRSTTDTAEVFGVGLVTAADQACVAIASDDGLVASPNCESIANTIPVSLRKDAAVFEAATFTSFTSDTMTLNYSTADGTARKWVGLFVERAAVTTLWAQSVM